jgi:hypothetical protein
MARVNACRLELAVMETIVAALSRLPDEPSRTRAVRWAMDALAEAPSEESTAAAPSATSLATTGPEPDGDLDVADLDHLFPATVTPAARGRAPIGQPIGSMVHGFVADFQKLVRDWHAADARR